MMSATARRLVVITAAAAALVGPGAAIAASPAQAHAAGLTCRAGTWGGIYGWGECSGSGKWQLKVSCTWGGQTTSAVITNGAHVDVKCNRGSALSASIIYR